MVRRFITVTLLTHVLGGCSLLAKESRMAAAAAAASCVPSVAFYAEVRNNHQQNWLRFLNACNTEN